MEIELTAQDGHKLKAYQCGPDSATAGVVVLPEIYGINAHIRSMADRFAAEGFRAITPSLFDRAAPDEPGMQLDYTPESSRRGMGLRRQINDEMALQDIAAAAAALKTPVLLVTGYCWGGFLSWRAICQDDTFKAAACWYGGGIIKHASDKAHGAVQMHFGGADPHIPMTDVESIRKAQPGVDVFAYKGATHAFGRPGGSAENANAAALAWVRTLQFFNEQAGH